MTLLGGSGGKTIVDGLGHDQGKKGVIQPREHLSQKGEKGICPTRREKRQERIRERH